MINKTFLGVALMAALAAWTVTSAPVNAERGVAHGASAVCSVSDCPLDAPKADGDCGSTCPVAGPGDGESAKDGCQGGKCPAPGAGDGEAAGCGGGSCPGPDGGDD